MKIFGMGGLEIVIILVVILLIFGPKNLPKLGSALGKTVSNLRSGLDEGKKKKQEAEAAASASDEAEPAEQTTAEAPVAIESAVEVVEEELAKVEPEPKSEPEPAPEPEQELEPDSELEAESEAESAADAPKKVRRVVKKKVTTEAPTSDE